MSIIRNVEIQDNRLTISGEMKQEKERKEENYHLREHRYGRFERTVMLPCGPIGPRRSSRTAS